MPKLTIQATEMKAAKAERISLVPRGANRIPIRIVKEESAMHKRLMDLANLGSIFKSDAAKAQGPVAVAVIALKGEGFESVKKSVGEAGFAVDKETEGEGNVVTFAQVDGEIAPDEVVVVKMSPEIAVAMKGFRPYNAEFSVGETSFAEACKAQGFYPGVSTMVDVLRSSVYDVVSKSDDPSAAAADIGKMFDEAKSYCQGLVSALPTKAFKLEAIEPEDEPEEDGDAPKAAVTEPTQKADDKSGEKKDGEPAATTAKKDEPAAETGEDGKPKEGDPAATTTQKSDEPKAEDLMAGFQKMLNEAMGGLQTKMNEAVTGVQKSVDSLTESVGVLGQRVEKAEGAAGAAYKAVTGTVLGEDAGDATITQKSDKGGSGYTGREIDTGMSDTRRNRRPSAR